MLLFELIDPILVSLPDFSSIPSQITELFKNVTFRFGQILQGTFCNFVAMVAAQTVMNSYQL